MTLTETEIQLDEVLSWIRDWVLTGEERGGEGYGEEPEHYAGWLDMGEMPECVVEMCR